MPDKYYITYCVGVDDGYPLVLQLGHDTVHYGSMYSARHGNLAPFGYTTRHLPWVDTSLYLMPVVKAVLYRFYTCNTHT